MIFKKLNAGWRSLVTETPKPPAAALPPVATAAGLERAATPWAPLSDMGASSADLSRRVAAVSEPDRGSVATTFEAALGAKTASLAVRVPLVRDESAKLVLLHFEAAQKLRLHDEPTGLYDAAASATVEGAFGLRRARDGETPTHFAIATKYSDSAAGQRGGVLGDGRAAMLADLPVFDAKTNALVGLTDVQVKGFPTGLAPRGENETSWHGHGLERLVVAVMDSVYAGYQAKNGMAANDWLAVMSTDAVVPESPDHFGSNNAGLTVRTGSFLRLAHFEHFRNDPKALRELFDLTNQQLCLKLGRTQPLSMAALAVQLFDHKASNLADQYWNRLYHGSTSYDNTGIFETIDHGTMGTVDRAHPQKLSTSAGFANEPKDVLDTLYKDVLLELMLTASTLAERKQLYRLEPEGYIDRIFERRMATRSLEHLGFDDGEGRNLFRSEPEAVRGFVKLLREVGEAPEPNHTHLVGPALNGRDVPAKFDLFQATSSLVEIASSGATPEVKQAQLAKALSPLKPQSMAEAHVAAGRLLAAFEPLRERAFANRSPEERSEALKATVDQARRINARVDVLERNNIWAIARSFVQRMKDPAGLATARAELVALQRGAQRRGPGSPLDIANRLNQRHLQPNAEGVLALRRQVENGVGIAEYSDGVKDWVELEVLGNPLGLGSLEDYRLEAQSTDGSWSALPAPEIRGSKALVRVSPPPAQLAIRVTGPGHPVWDNGGLGFGKNWSPAVQTGLVDQAMSAYAKRNGLVREHRLVPAPSLIGSKLPRAWLDDYFADESLALASLGGLDPQGAGTMHRPGHLVWGAKVERTALRENLKQKIGWQLDNHRADRAKLAEYYGDLVMRQAALQVPALVPADANRAVHVAWARQVPLEQLRRELTYRLDLAFEAFDDRR